MPFPDVPYVLDTADKIWAALGRKRLARSVSSSSGDRREARERKAVRGGATTGPKANSPWRRQPTPRNVGRAGRRERQVSGEIRACFSDLRDRKNQRRNSGKLCSSDCPMTPKRNCASPRKSSAKSRASAWRNYSRHEREHEITTHVLDISLGTPGRGRPVVLEIEEAGTGWKQLGRGETDKDGRLARSARCGIAGGRNVPVDVRHARLFCRSARSRRCIRR